MALTPFAVLPAKVAGARTPVRPVRAYAGFALAGLATLALAQGALFPGAPGVARLVALAGYAAASAATWGLLARHFPHRQLGWCNVATQARLVLVALLATPLLGGAGAGWAVALLAVGALALDGLDGWLARRQRLASRFGARFDVEVDSGLALTLALHALAGGQAGPAVLALGLARYGFVAAGAALPRLRAPLPERFSRKVVCVAQLAVLIALQLPAMPWALAQGLTWAVAAALVWSFGRDVAWLLRGAGRRPWR